MERIPTFIFARNAWGILLAGCVLVTTVGCHLLDTCSEYTGLGHREPVCSVVMVFEPFISVADDTISPGGQIPGLLGQVWLFTDEGKRTVPARGMIEAELFDMTHAGSGKLPERLADWKFFQPDLRLLKREDKVGIGYTLFLPWEKYEPSIKKVQLRLTYIDEHGQRHAPAPASLTLRGLKEQIPVHIDVQKNVPVSHLTPRK